MKMTTRNLVCFIIVAILPAMIHSPNVIAQEYVKSDFLVSDITDFNYKAPQLSVSKTGNMVVVWETVGTGQIWFKKISSQGTILSEKKMIVSPFTTDVTRVAFADSGNFMVIYGGYTDSWSVYGQVYDSQGSEIDDTLEVDRNSTEFINAYNASLSADFHNQFGVLLPGLDSMMVEKFTGAGEFVGNTMFLKPDAAYVTNLTGIMSRSGELIMVWGDGIGFIRGQRYTPEGIPIGGSFQVGQLEEGSYLQNLALASDTSGNFVVVWSGSFEGRMEMYSQLFSAKGIQIGSKAKITDDVAIYNIIQGKMSIGMDEDGKYVIVWPDTRSSDTTFIYMQQMNDSGEPVGGNYRATSINNDILPGALSLPVQINPVVRILRDTIYLAWANFNGDVSIRQNIFANIQKWKIPDLSGNEIVRHMPAGIRCYPNPSTGTFRLSLDQKYTGQLEWEVYNSTGTIVRRNPGNGSGLNAIVDLSQAPVGMYHIKIMGDTFTSTLPLIIIR